MYVSKPLRRKQGTITTAYEVLGNHPGPRKLQVEVVLQASNHARLSKSRAVLVTWRHHDTGHHGMVAEQDGRSTFLKSFGNSATTAWPIILSTIMCFTALSGSTRRSYERLSTCRHLVALRRGGEATRQLFEDEEFSPSPALLLHRSPPGYEEIGCRFTHLLPTSFVEEFFQCDSIEPTFLRYLNAV
jgi:hypothetical protein